MSKAICKHFNQSFISLKPSFPVHGKQTGYSSRQKGFQLLFTIPAKIPNLSAHHLSGPHVPSSFWSLLDIFQVPLYWREMPALQSQNEKSQPFWQQTLCNAIKFNEDSGLKPTINFYVRHCKVPWNDVDTDFWSKD